MAINDIWSCIGFEATGTSLLSGAGGTYDANYTTQKKSGAQSFRVYPTASVGYCYVGRRDWDYGTTDSNNTSSGAMHYGFWFRINGSIPAAATRIAALASTAATGNWLYLATDGKLKLYSNGTDDTGTLIGTSSTALSADTWYHIEVFIKSGSQKVWLNGNSSAEITGTSTSVPAATGQDRVYLGPATGTSTCDFCYDDFYWFDGEHTSNLGAGVIALLYPTGAGTDSGFASGTNSSDYQEIDEGLGHDSDTTYVAASGVDVVTYNLTNCATAGISGSVLGIHAVYYIKDSGTNTWYMRIRDSGGNARDQAVPYDGSTAYNDRGWAKAFDPYTGTWWTTSGIDALQAGFGITAFGTYARVSSLTVHVLYIPSSGTTPLIKRAYGPDGQRVMTVLRM